HRRARAGRHGPSWLRGGVDRAAVRRSRVALRPRIWAKQPVSDAGFLPRISRHPPDTVWTFRLANRDRESPDAVWTIRHRGWACWPRRTLPAALVTLRSAACGAERPRSFLLRDGGAPRRLVISPARPTDRLAVLGAHRALTRQGVDAEEGGA